MYYLGLWDEKQSTVLDPEGDLLLHTSPNAHVCFQYFCCFSCIIIFIIISIIKKYRYPRSHTKQPSGKDWYFGSCIEESCVFGMGSWWMWPPLRMLLSLLIWSRKLMGFELQVRGSSWSAVVQWGEDQSSHRTATLCSETGKKPQHSHRSQIFRSYS